jgi:hypothetical protein
MLHVKRFAAGRISFRGAAKTFGVRLSYDF